MQRLTINTKHRIELIDIAPQVRSVLRSSGIADGVCVVFCPHTTAGLTINENADPAVAKDITGALNKMIPANGDYAHAEGNSDSHIKSSLLGATVSVIVEQGRLLLGTWQGIYFCESDGPRAREVWIKILKG